MPENSENQQNNNIKNEKTQNIIQNNTNINKNLSKFPEHKRSNIRINPERVKELRKERKLTQKALGKRIGVSKQAISNWENTENIVYIREKNLEKLARSLTCTPDYLKDTVDNKFSYWEGNQVYHWLGMPLSLIPEIMCHLRFYFDEQLNYLSNFLHVFEILSLDQLELLIRITSAIAGSNIPSITSWCPLCDFNFFNRIFLRTKHRFNEIRETLDKEAKDYKTTIPDKIEDAFSYFDKAMKKNYDCLSCPLQNKEKFKKSLNHIQKSFDYFIDSLPTLFNTETNAKTRLDKLKLYKESFLDDLNKDLNADIESFFCILNPK